MPRRVNTRGAVEALQPAASLSSPQTPDAIGTFQDEEDARSSPTLGLYLCLVFIFFRFSFLHELITAKTGFDSHLLLIVGASAILAALLTGGLFNGVSNKISLCWFGFAACMVAATGTSIWRGGSFAVLFPYLRTTMILLVLIPAVAMSTKSLTRVVKTIGIAGLAAVLLGVTVNDYRSGRLELSGAGASIENSNDYAALLILVMPAIAYLTMRRGTSIVFKLIGMAALSLSCFLILSTGSRGALISLVVSILYVLKAGSGKVRIAILLGLPLAGLIIFPFVPATSSQRLASMFNSKDSTEESSESKDQRTALLMASLQITAKHPLLGVGPGTFQEYEAQEAKDRGQRGMWHETHNSYTQVSSECGVPALIFYLAGIILTFSVFRRGRKSSDPDIRSISSILGLMLVSFCFCMFFLAQAYGFGFPVMAGIAVSLDRLLKRENEMTQLDGAAA